MSFKHRGTSKISFKHPIVEGLRKYLEKIEEIEEISLINLGGINKSKLTGKFEFRIQYSTPSGLKCVAKSPQGAVQDVYVVTSYPDIVKEKLKEIIK